MVNFPEGKVRIRGKYTISSFPLRDIYLKIESEMCPPPPKKKTNKFRCKTQCNEVPYKSSYSEMLAYLDNHVREAVKCGWEGRGEGRCLIWGGSYFNFVCFGGGLIRSGSLLERGIQIKEIAYTQHLGRNGCVWEGVRWVQTLFRGRWLDISKVHFTPCPIVKDSYLKK